MKKKLEYQFKQKQNFKRECVKPNNRSVVQMKEIKSINENQYLFVIVKTTVKIAYSCFDREKTLIM